MSTGSLLAIKGEDLTMTVTISSSALTCIQTTTTTNTTTTTKVFQRRMFCEGCKISHSLCEISCYPTHSVREYKKHLDKKCNKQTVLSTEHNSWQCGKLLLMCIIYWSTYMFLWAPLSALAASPITLSTSVFVLAFCNASRWNSIVDSVPSICCNCFS